MDLLRSDLHCRTMPGRPGVGTQHLEPTQEGPVLLPEGEAVPPESGQLNKTAIRSVKFEGNFEAGRERATRHIPEISYLMLYERHVKHTR